jgi:hypothetical protein
MKRMIKIIFRLKINARYQNSGGSGGRRIVFSANKKVKKPLKEFKW